MKTDSEQPGVTQAPASREECPRAKASWALGKEVEQRPRKPSSVDLTGLCFHGISCGSLVHSIP